MYTQANHRNTMRSVYTGALFAIFLGIIVFAILLFSGCGAYRTKNVTNLPPGVTQQQAQNWDKAVADLHQIAATVSTVRRAVIQIRGAGAFPSDEYYAEVIRALGHIDQLELSAEGLLRTTPKAFGQKQKSELSAFVGQISTELEQLNTVGATGIKNPDSLKQINTYIADLAATVKLVIALTS